VAKTALKLLLVFVEYTENNSRSLYEAVQVDDDAQGNVLCQQYTLFVHYTIIFTCLRGGIWFIIEYAWCVV
jgi:hypothetical protein